VPLPLPLLLLPLCPLGHGVDDLVLTAPTLSTPSPTHHPPRFRVAALLACIVGSALAFVPSASSRTPVRALTMAEKSRSIPILNKPKNLDGSMVRPMERHEHPCDTPH